MVRQLPIIEHNGKRYFRDDRLRQIRNLENPHDYINFEEMNGANKHGG